MATAAAGLSDDKHRSACPRSRSGSSFGRGVRYEDFEDARRRSDSGSARSRRRESRVPAAAGSTLDRVLVTDVTPAVDLSQFSLASRRTNVFRSLSVSGASKAS